MLTLSNGIKKPEDGDRGSLFWDALADNAQIQNDHTHDGQDSELIPATSTQALTQDISVWSDQGIAGFRATVTLPTGITFSDFQMEFIVTVSDDAAQVGSRMLPTIIKVTEGVYYAYVYKTGMTLRAVYR